jgi:hypothetical protein
VVSFQIGGSRADFVDGNQQVRRSIRWSVLLFPLSVPTFSGCVDGPLFELKKLNPIVQRQWRADRERGDVFSMRVKEMQLLATQFPSMPEAEQAKWASTVSSIVETETSSEIRREAVMALAKVMKQPAAASAVVKLSKDKSDKVRLAVSKAMRNEVTPEVTQALLAMATSDKSESVRLSATESLGSHKTDEVRQYLAKQLSDRSPAMQYYASVALRDFTGKDFKGDVGLWKRYLAGENVEPPDPTFLETAQSFLPFTR